MKTGTEKIESVKEHAKSEMKTLNNKKVDEAAILLHQSKACDLIT